MKRPLTFALIVLVVAGLAALIYVRFLSQPAAAASTANLNTVSVQRGSLSATVNAGGNVSPAMSVALDFQQSGVVQAVPARVGNQVKAGQVLAQLDAASLSLAVDNARANLQAAQDKLTQAKNPSSPQDIAGARAALDSAQANYAKLAAPPKASDLRAARAAVTGAQAAYDAAVKSAGTSNTQLNAAAQAVEQAQAALSAAQAAYDKVKNAANIGMRAESVTLQQDTIAYQTALANYQSLAATIPSSANSTVQQARSQLEQALATLAKTEQPNMPQDLQTAQDQVAQAQASLDKLLAGSDAATIDIAQTAVDQANTALKQAQLALQQAQLTAPFDGVVTAINVTPGGASNAGGTAGAIQIADLAHLQVVANLAEVDVAKIQAGQVTQLTLDALAGVTVQGKVSLIAPAGVLTQGVVNYPVTIQLIDAPASVKTGMTANLNIITQEKDNVLMVPNRAVRTVGRQKMVTVLFEGQQIQTPVQTGMNSDTNTEITSGLQEGDVVVVNGTNATQPRTGGGFVPGVGGFGRGG